MTDLRKAAEMALEALETLWDILDDIDTASDVAKENDAWYRKRVEALQKKRWDTTITTDGYKLKGGPVEALRQALAQPEQKPVGWMYVNTDGECEQIEYGPIPFWDDAITLLYTSPPKREWVGLTEEEFSDLLYFDGRLDHVEVPLIADFIRSIQAKLKEKNDG